LDADTAIGGGISNNDQTRAQNETRKQKNDADNGLRKSGKNYCFKNSTRSLILREPENQGCTIVVGHQNYP